MLGHVEEQGYKADDGKLRYDLIPWDPGIVELARVYTVGAKKYGDRNWEKGIKYTRLFAALVRHLLAYWFGETHDPENGQHHLGAVIFYCLAFMYFDANAPQHDDRGTT